MTEPTRHPGGGMPSPLDPTALLEAQTRLLAALARSGQIVAEATRRCAERQAELARAALHDLLASSPLARGLDGASRNSGALQDQAARLSALVERIGREIGQMQQIVADAQGAVLAELGRAFESGPAPTARGETAPAAAATKPSVPSATAPAATAATAAPTAAPTETAPSVEETVAAATGPVESATEAPVEPARPRRPRKVAAEG